MSRLNTMLVAVLAVQLGLAALTWWPSGAETYEARTIVDVPKDKVTELLIEGKASGDGETPSVRLTRDTTGWVLTSSFGYPADAEKVDEIVGSLLGMKLQRPIATTTTSHAALGVADGDFGRRVKVIAGDESWEMVIGPSSGKSSNVRMAGEDDVYNVQGFSQYTLKDRPASYWDPNLLELDKAKVDSLSIKNELGAFRLARADGSWHVAGLPEGAESPALDQGEVDKLVGRVARLRIRDVMAREAEPAMGLGHAAVEWTTSAEGASSSGSYLVGTPTGGEVPVKLQGKDWIVTVAETSQKGLFEATLDGLLAKEAASGAGAAAVP